MQVLLGDLPSAVATQEAFFGIWQRYGALPERYILNAGLVSQWTTISRAGRTHVLNGSVSMVHSDIHNSERYYPLRPEFMESTYFLYKGTQSHEYLWVITSLSLLLLYPSLKFG
jgi:mannosidase alpha-like ER degradation enhancer 1